MTLCLVVKGRSILEGVAQAQQFDGIVFCDGALDEQQPDEFEVFGAAILSGQSDSSYLEA